MRSSTGGRRKTCRPLRQQPTKDQATDPKRGQEKACESDGLCAEEAVERIGVALLLCENLFRDSLNHGQGSIYVLYLFLWS